MSKRLLLNTGFALSLAFGAVGTGAWAQEATLDTNANVLEETPVVVDPCAEVDCITDPVVIATGGGSFVGAGALSSEDDADKIAAIEQQALREFRWDVMASIKVELAFIATPGTRPSGWSDKIEIGSNAATAMVLVSNDGETFAPLPDTSMASEGQVLAVLVFQKSEIPEGGKAYFLPSTWTYELSVQPSPPMPGTTLGAMLIPIAFGDDLGCEDAGCGEPAEGLAVPNVTGKPRSDAGAAPVSRAVADELARELQTELARVGCYAIAIDGLWGPGSRKAMTAYNTAKGESLPVQSPTPTALVAVAKEAGKVCAP